MSTRATYCFKAANSYQQDQTFYVHHDGYPSGAAAKFYLMATYDGEGAHNCLAADFFRANGQTQFTESHESHGDTEYRYTISRCPESKMIMIEWSVICYDANKWDNKGQQTLAAFIENNNEFTKDEPQLNKALTHNMITAAKYIKENMTELASFIATDNCNAKGYAEKMDEAITGIEVTHDNYEYVWLFQRARAVVNSVLKPLVV